MFDKFASITEETKQEEFLKTKIQEAFNLFVKNPSQKDSSVDKREIPYIMRYLGQFPSEAQVRDAILPELEEDEVSEYIKYDKFEPFMLDVLKKKTYEMDDTETLLAAFKLLDPENKGYIEVEYMKNILEKEGIEFREGETKSFVQFATNKDPSATVIYYEDYISRLNNTVEKHLENVMKGYDNFKVQK